MRAIRYTLLSFLSFLISFIGFIGVKVAIIAVAIGIAFLSEKYIGNFGLFIGYIIGLCVAGLLFMGLEKLSPYLERLDDYTQTFKKKSYTNKYGINYIKPIPEDFAITETEFKEYNSRFQFKFIQLLFTYGILITTAVYVVREKIKGTQGILILGIAGMAALILHYLFEYWNKRISIRHRYYQKIHKYQESLRIYYKVRDENSKV